MSCVQTCDVFRLLDGLRRDAGHRRPHRHVVLRRVVFVLKTSQRGFWCHKHAWNMEISYQFFERWLIDLRSVQSANRIFCVTSILELDECKAWRIASDPDISQRTVFAERAFDFVLGCRRTQIPDVHFTLDVPLSESGHAVVVGALAIGAITSTGWKVRVGREKSHYLCADHSLQGRTKIALRESYPSGV